MYDDGYLPDYGGMYQQNNRYVELIDLVKAVNAISAKELKEIADRKKAKPASGKTDLLRK